jgi:hypothetical protein
MRQIQSTASLLCPVKECKKDLSVRDVKDLLPKTSKKDDSFLNPTKGTGKATERLMNGLASTKKKNSKPLILSLSLFFSLCRIETHHSVKSREKRKLASLEFVVVVFFFSLLKLRTKGILC